MDDFPAVEFDEGEARNARRGGQFVVFDVRPKKNEKRTAEQGFPAYDNVEFIRIVTPGEKYNIPERPVRKKDRVMWAREYAAFKAGIQDAPTGTPLSQWPPISKAEVEELRYGFNAHTVEQLADMSDGVLQGMPMHLRRRSKQAKDWMEQARTGARTVELREELEKRDGEIELLKRQMADMVLRMDASNAKQESFTMDAAESIKHVTSKRK